MTHNPKEPFLEIDVKGGEREITSKLNHFKRGESTSTGRVIITSKAPNAWSSRGEKTHVFKRGKIC